MVMGLQLKGHMQVTEIVMFKLSSQGHRKLVADRMPSGHTARDREGCSSNNLKSEPPDF